MSGGVRDASDDTVAPVVDYLLGSVCEHLTRDPQVALVFLSKSRADFQIIQFPHRDRRPGNFPRSVRVSWNRFGGFYQGMFSIVRLSAGRLPPDLPAEETPHQVGYIVALLLEREVACVEQVKLQILQVSLVWLGAGWQGRSDRSFPRQ